MSLLYISGEPSAVLTWSLVSDTQTTFLHTGSELEFNTVDLEDNGQYVCQPTNDVGDGPPGYYDLVVNGEYLHSTLRKK